MHWEKATGRVVARDQCNAMGEDSTGILGETVQKAKVERGVTRELLPQHLDLTWRSKVLLTRGGKFSMQNSMILILGVNMIQSFLHIALLDRITITWVV